MEVLKDYNDEEQNYIVNSGVLIYKYSKNQLIFKDKMSGDVNTNYLIEKKRNDEMGEKIKRLEDTIKNMESDSFKKEMDIKKKMYMEREEEIKQYQLKINKVREEAVKESQQRCEYLKTDLERERKCRKEEVQRMELCLKGVSDTNEYLKKKFDSEMEDKIQSRVVVYKEEIDKLKKENKEYFDKYENKNKGKIFEEEFYNLVEEYNDKEEGNKWKISHVGSKYGGMCDIVFKHKDTGHVIMVESKNNLEKNPVPTKDVDKFYRDVLDVNNNAVGGIIISTAKIQKKRSYEREVVQNKVLIFLSHFCLENIGQLFCNLEYIIGENQINNNDLNKEERNGLLVRQFSYYIEEGNFHKTRSKRAYDKSEEIREIYYKLNQEDIKLIKNDEKTEKKSKKQPEIKIKYEDLEENCNKVKKIKNEKQTKFYVKHKDEKGEIILQYFSDNYKVEKKIEKLEIEGKTIITHSKLKKERKVLKKERKVLNKEETVNNIKISTIFD